MILVTHSLIGAVIGKNIDTPLIIVGVSFATHFLLDTIHHGEYLNSQSKFKDTAWKVALDLFVGAALLFLYVYSSDFTHTTTRNIILGSLASIFPDFVTLLSWIFPNKLLTRIHRFHKWIHELNPRYKENIAWNLHNARNDILISLSAIILLFL